MVTASPWTPASATLRSSGSRRSRAARSSTGCSSGSSERRDGGGGGSNRVEVRRCPMRRSSPLFNKLTTKSNPCLERETPLESRCSYCGLLTIQRYFFVYFVVCSWSLLTAGGFGGFKEEQTLPALYVSDTRGRFLNFSSTCFCSHSSRRIFFYPNKQLLFFSPSPFGTYFNTKSGQCLI